MLRLTGPGKIRELQLPANISATTFQAILFNFDIDGDALKPQHRAWLSEHVVPQLGDPQLKITLRGEASRTGSDAYNLDLSRRRVAQVVSFFQANGPVLADVSTNWVGEADAQGRGEADNTEDELVRAVIIKVERSARRFVPIVFDSVGSFFGFDPGANPPWVMMPAGSAPRIMEIENAEGLSLVSSNAGVARPQPALFTQQGPVRITRRIQRFRIVAGVNGDAEIRAVDASGRIHARLAVSVLPQLTVKCAFHYVQNARYGTRARSRGDEAGFITGLNDVWGPQANIVFEQIAGGAADLTMTDNLGDSINTDAKFDAIVRHRKRAAQFNVFFVREVEQNRNLGDNDDALTFVGPPGDCVFEDDIVPSLSFLISHEAGHCLSIDHNDPIPATNDMLMNHFATHSFIPRVHVLRARRSVRR
jgi:hypothetical protein